MEAQVMLYPIGKEQFKGKEGKPGSYKYDLLAGMRSRYAKPEDLFTKVQLIPMFSSDNYKLTLLEPVMGVVEIIEMTRNEKSSDGKYTTNSSVRYNVLSIDAEILPAEGVNEPGGDKVSKGNVPF